VDGVQLEEGNVGGRTVLGKWVVRMSWTGLAQESGLVAMSCAVKSFGSVATKTEKKHSVSGKF
jgi:hypothetical protein